MSICIGLALITKAEFDSALADFNSRLTTFEAGINSKIDSQVTSYLDRNGIWSGKSQGAQGLKWRVGENIEHTKYMQTATTNSNSVWIADSFIGAVPLCKITKSGLAVIQIIDDNEGIASTVGPDYKRMKIVNNTGGNISNNSPVFINSWIYSYVFLELSKPGDGIDYLYGHCQTALNESTYKTKGWKLTDGSFLDESSILQEYIRIQPYVAYVGIRGTGSDNSGTINPALSTGTGCNTTCFFFVNSGSYLGFGAHSFWQIQFTGSQSAYRLIVDHAPMTHIKKCEVY